MSVAHERIEDGFVLTTEASDVPVLDAEAAAVREESTARRVGAIAAAGRAAVLNRRHDAVVGMRRLSRELFAEALPDYAELRRRWATEVELVSAGFHHGDELLDLDDLFPIWPVVEPGGDGDFRFAGSSSFSNNVDVRFGSERPWNKMWGHLDHTADANDRYSFGVIETYGLTPDRFPATRSTRFEIDTDVRIIGVVSGWTGGYHWLWAADDKWCKVWLNIRHTVKRGDGLVLGQHVRPTLELVHLENVSPVGQANPVLNGGYGGRVLVDVDLADVRRRQSMLTVDVEVRFDVELEGDAEVWFRDHGGSAAQSVPAVDNAVRWANAPMILRPI